MVHPVSPDWYVGGSVLVPGFSGSVVEITRFQVHRFTEVARIVVEECLAPRRN
jgi:hypothetical protein